jgi:hypothetical protein
MHKTLLEKPIPNKNTSRSDNYLFIFAPHDFTKYSIDKRKLFFSFNI